MLAALFLDYSISSGTSATTSNALDGLIWASTGNPVTGTACSS